RPDEECLEALNLTSHAVVLLGGDHDYYLLTMSRDHLGAFLGGTTDEFAEPLLCFLNLPLHEYLTHSLDSLDSQPPNHPSATTMALTQTLSRLAAIACSVASPSKVCVSNSSN